MAMTAVMVQYANPSTSSTGFLVDLQVAYSDSATGQRIATNINAVELPDGNPAGWDGIIKNAIIARATEFGFPAPALNRIYMPKFST